MPSKIQLIIALLVASVWGQENSTETVIDLFSIDGAPAETVAVLSARDTLAFTVTRPTWRYREGPKLSVRLDGEWIDLTNENWQCRVERERIFGCLSGANSEATVSRPAQITEGEEIVFRVNGIDSLSMGSRIIINDAVVTSSELPNGDATRGRSLWRSAQLIDFPGGPGIKSTCGDCHFTDGADLKLFGFHFDTSIIRRSQFHGLTEQEGADISAYIAALEIDVKGTPRSRPGQPGKSDDALSWLVGSDQLLDKDADMREVFMAMPIEGFDLSEMPIAVPMPAIHDWWPRHHWKDINPQFDNTSEWYAEYHQITDTPLKRKARRLATKYNRDRQRGHISAGLDCDETLSMQQFIAARSIEKFLPEIEQSDGYRRPRKYSLFGGRELAFDLSEHLLGSPRIGVAEHRKCGAKSVGTVGQPYFDERASIYFASAWYNAQAYLNGGLGEPAFNGPVDLNYQWMFLRGIQSRLGFDPSYMALAIWIDQLQVHDTGEIDGSGMRMRSLNPYEVRTFLAAIQSDTEAIEKAVGAWIDILEKYDPADWPLVGTVQNSKESIPWPDFAPIDGRVGNVSDPRGNRIPTQRNYPNQIYSVMKSLESYGVDAEMLKRIAVYCEELWSVGDWERWM